MKKALSMVLALIIALSSFLSVTAADFGYLSQFTKSYNHLRSYLLTFGDYNKTTEYYSFFDYYHFGENDEWIVGLLISVSKESDNINFHEYVSKSDSTVVSDTIEFHMEIYKDVSKGVRVSAISQYNSGKQIFGIATVSPPYFTDGNINFDYYDVNHKAIPNSELNGLEDSDKSLFSLCLSDWNRQLEYEADISLGNFGFTKLFDIKKIPGSFSEVKIANNPKKTTVPYQSNLILYPECKDCLEGYHIVWYIDGKAANVVDDGIILTCYSSCTVTVRVEDDDGNPILNSLGEE